MPEEPETGQIIDSGPVVLQATTQPEPEEDVTDGGDSSSAGE